MDEELEKRFDQLEAWRIAEDAAKKEKADEIAKRHLIYQGGLAVLNTLLTIGNLYVTAK